MKFNRWNPIPIEPGQRFGRLTVLRVESNGKHRRAFCLCDCGTETRQAPHDLNSGKVVACGCFRLERCSGKEPDESRFWRRVEKSDGCWLWTGNKIKNGYGRFELSSGKPMLAHRFSFQLHGGTLEAGKELDHLCRTPACVNPTHLEQLTRQQHAKRSLLSTKTHCKHGHPFSGHNLILRPRGGRTCRACRDQQWAAFRANWEAAQKAKVAA